MKQVELHLILFLLLPSPVLAGSKIQILLPADHVSTSVPSIHIVGRTSSPGVLFRLNGNRTETAVTRDGVFHARLGLPFGLNRIAVMPYAEGVADTAAAEVIEVMCAPQIAPSYAKLYTFHRFHNGESPGECLECHNPGGETAGDTGLSWCVTCHPLTGNNFKQHVAGRPGTCTDCHRISRDLTLTTTGQYSDMNPCYGCHTDKIGQYAQDYIHGPVAGGTCTVCHNPHGSNYEKNLRSPVPFLCMFCHTAIEEVRAKVQHPPFEEGRCTACHDPHSTGNRWVLLKSTGELCLTCHEGKLDNHRHRYEVKPRQRLAIDLELNDKGRIECLTCHEPHATDSAHLLKTTADNPCVGCHPGHK